LFSLCLSYFSSAFISYFSTIPLQPFIYLFLFSSFVFYSRLIPDFKQKQAISQI
jgi:hypothetical protein